DQRLALSRALRARLTRRDEGGVQGRSGNLRATGHPCRIDSAEHHLSPKDGSALTAVKRAFLLNNDRRGFVVPMRRVIRRRCAEGSLRESAPNAKTMLSGRVRGVDGHVLERQRAADAEPQLSATGLLDADGAGAFVEPPLQEDQPRLQVLRKFRKPERPVKPEFPVGELDPSGPDVFQGELPEDCAGDTLDQIVVVDK